MLSPDILVVGLGAVGSATLYQAAKRGARVVGIDRFVPPHDQGSSHGDTRITRQAIGEGREFVPLALRSHQIWREIEAATGRDLLTCNGGLVVASPNVPGNHHGSKSFLQDTIDTASEFGIPHEVLPTDEIRRRYPQFALRGDEAGYFEPGAGFVRPEACIEAQLELARRAGAQIVTSQTVTEITPQRDGTVAVKTQSTSYSAAKVIVTAGPWIAKLVGDDYRHHFKVLRQMLCWFEVRRNAPNYAPEKFPIFIWIAGDQPRDMIYGFPAIDGPDGGVKIATEQYEATVDPDDVPRTIDPAEVAALHDEYIAPRFPDVGSKCLRSTTCLYTVTPDAKFIVDHLNLHPNVLMASACSGHGFKHSAALGEALSQMALGEKTDVDLCSFRMSRFNLS